MGIPVARLAPLMLFVLLVVPGAEAIDAHTLSSRSQARSRDALTEVAMRMAEAKAACDGVELYNIGECAQSDDDIVHEQEPARLARVAMQARRSFVDDCTRLRSRRECAAELREAAERFRARRD